MHLRLSEFPATPTDCVSVRGHTRGESCEHCIRGQLEYGPTRAEDIARTFVRNALRSFRLQRCTFSRTAPRRLRLLAMSPRSREWPQAKNKTRGNGADDVRALISSMINAHGHLVRQSGSPVIVDAASGRHPENKSMIVLARHLHMKLCRKLTLQRTSCFYVPLFIKYLPALLPTV